MRIQGLTFVDDAGKESSYDVSELVELINTDSLSEGLKLSSSEMACPMCCECEITKDHGVVLVYQNGNMTVYSQLFDGLTIPDHLRLAGMKAVDIVIANNAASWSSGEPPIVHETGCTTCNMV